MAEMSDRFKYIGTTLVIEAEKGRVWVYSKEPYAFLPPEVAREYAYALLRAADEAEGKVVQSKEHARRRTETAL